MNENWLDINTREYWCAQMHTLCVYIYIYIWILVFLKTIVPLLVIFVFVAHFMFVELSHTDYTNQQDLPI